MRKLVIDCDNLLDWLMRTEIAKKSWIQTSGTGDLAFKLLLKLPDAAEMPELGHAVGIIPSRGWTDQVPAIKWILVHICRGRTILHGYAQEDPWAEVHGERSELTLLGHNREDPYLALSKAQLEAFAQLI